jgi:hypothetical protein
VAGRRQVEAPAIPAISGAETLIVLFIRRWSKMEKYIEICPPGYQVEKRETEGEKRKRTVFCLILNRKIVFVMWDEPNWENMRQVIEQIEALRATQKLS